ncbi:MAG TPA: hypothetical protein ENK63_00220 [Rhodobacterales bacterium]|nr:hypothetical protein [Rhodobacterales bacterium]
MILRPTSGPEDWRAFLAKPEHWRPGRSAMETAHAWEGAEGLPPEIATLLPGASLFLAIPEYKVPLPGGQRESQNDVFALLVDDLGVFPCMVEAKRDEPFGPTLDEWRAKPSKGKTERLEAICGLLGLDPGALDGSLRYQLFHRTASAAITAQRLRSPRAAMVVQSFSPERRWFGDFFAFAALFGLAPEPDRAVSTDLPGGIALSLAWASAPLRTQEMAP